jgi:hypothetical protein
MTLVHFQKNIRGVITVVKETKEFNMAAENIDIIVMSSILYVLSGSILNTEILFLVYSLNLQSGL